MAVLVEFTCTRCHATAERWADASTRALTCPSCGEPARRGFGGALVGRAAAAPRPAPAAASYFGFDCFGPPARPRTEAAAP
jgi:NAD-dependent SIR2 family protein deacetylase